MKFEQILVYYSESELSVPDGVLSFRVEDIASFYVYKGQKVAQLGIRGGAQNSYTVIYDDLKKILDKY